EGFLDDVFVGRAGTENRPRVLQEAAFVAPHELREGARVSLAMDMKELAVRVVEHRSGSLSEARTSRPRALLGVLEKSRAGFEPPQPTQMLCRWRSPTNKDALSFRLSGSS